MDKISAIFKTVFVLCWMLMPLRATSQTTLKPNIVILISDDHGAEDTGFSGNTDVITPVMDGLASEGMVFTNAHAPASVCAPSRSSIYTGLYTHRHGCHQNHASIKSGIKTLPQYLGEQGYKVALAGKVHVAPASSFPFDYIERQEIPAFLASAKNGPFCLIVAYNNPHEPYFNKKNGTPFRSIKAKEWMPDTPETRLLTAAYYDNVENLDNEIGSTLYWLEKSGLADNTMVIYTSDHGPGLPYGKWTLYEKALHVPLVVKWKGVIKPGTSTNAMVSLVDILPTLLDVSGAKIPSNLDGKSMIPLMKGAANTHHDYIFAAYSNIGVHGANSYPIRSIRNERYKLLVNYNHTEPFTIRMILQPDDRALICGYRVLESWKDAAAYNEFAAARHRLFRERPKIELYDLLTDPHELNNIANQPHVLSIQKNLLQHLNKWMVKQGDYIAKEI
jgi:N-sulfoglucosamine sulfohydrolase